MTYLDLFPYINGVLSSNENDVENSIRAWRNAQLAASDWTQLPDVPLANKWDWAVYREELREMMNKGVPPKEIVFPTPPI